MKYLLFELIEKNGHKYKLYSNGTTEGFPKGTVVVNHALSLLDYLLHYLPSDKKNTINSFISNQQP